MTDEQRLNDALHHIVPTPPDRPERGAAVVERVRRRRRRTAGAVALGVAAVVTAAVAVPAALSSGGEGEGPVADPSPTVTARAVEATCPPRDQEPTGPGTLPTGAITVRLCQGPGMAFQAPADALTTGVGDLVELVNAQPEGARDPMCTMDLGVGYQLVFGYPDGEQRAVSGELYGCHELRVGAVARTNPEAPYRRFIRSLRDQRADQTPPADAASRPGCASEHSPIARPAEMVAATLCVRYPTATEAEPVAIDVPDADLPALLDDWTRRDAAYDPEAPQLDLVGETAWGDRTSRYLDLTRWAPGPEAQIVLDRLLDRAERPAPQVDASSSAGEVVAAYVDLLNAHDTAGATALWHRLGTADLPEGYTRIDYKLEGVRPLRTISAYPDATAVRALYREVVRDADTPYRETVFTVGRDEDGVLRIVHVNVGEVIETGR